MSLCRHAEHDEHDLRHGDSAHERQDHHVRRAERRVSPDFSRRPQAVAEGPRRSDVRRLFHRALGRGHARRGHRRHSRGRAVRHVLAAQRSVHRARAHQVHVAWHPRGSDHGHGSESAARTVHLGSDVSEGVGTERRVARVLVRRGIGNHEVGEGDMPRSILLCAAAFAIAAPAFAHHGPGTFELAKTVSFPGAKLTRIEMLNPHGWLYFETTAPDGKVMKHRCEMRSAHVLRRSGWSPELFKSGEKVDITASPDRADAASCYLQTIVFANGSRMDRYGQYVKAPTGEVKEVRGPIKPVNLNRPARRPSGEPNITGDWAPEQSVMANPRGVGGGMVRLSALPAQPPEVGQRQARAGGAAAPTAAAAPAAAAAGGRGAAGPRTYGGTEVTERGEKEAAAATREDNPRFRCETTSIIF